LYALGGIAVLTGFVLVNMVHKRKMEEEEEENSSSIAEDAQSQHDHIVVAVGSAAVASPAVAASAALASGRSEAVALTGPSSSHSPSHSRSLSPSRFRTLSEASEEAAEQLQQLQHSDGPRTSEQQLQQQQLDSQSTRALHAALDDVAMTVPAAAAAAPERVAPSSRPTAPQSLELQSLAPLAGSLHGGANDAGDDDDDDLEQHLSSAAAAAADEDASSSEEFRSYAYTAGVDELESALRAQMDPHSLAATTPAVYT
jgi:hypothetical protein